MCAAVIGIEGKPERVRLADRRDEEGIYRLLVEMHRVNNAGWGWPYNPGLVTAQIEAGTRLPGSQRANPMDKRIGMIGVVDGPRGLIATIGCFTDQTVWFSDAQCLRELWVYVSPEARDEALYKDLFDFGLWAHAVLTQNLGEHYPFDFPYMTGYMHCGDPRMVDVMERLWRRYSGGVKCGTLFIKR